MLYVSVGTFDVGGSFDVGGTFDAFYAMLLILNSTLNDFYFIELDNYTKI